MTLFRKRIGEAGVEEIFKISVEIHKEKTIMSDKKLKTIAGRLLHEFYKNYNKEILDKYKNKLVVFEKVLEQKKILKIKFIAFMSRMFIA